MPSPAHEFPWKRRILAVAVAFVLTLLVDIFLNANANDSPIELHEAREILAEARALSEADAGRLWGIPLHGPILLVDPQTRFVVANQPDGEDHLTEKEGLFVGRLPESESIANTAYRWAGETWTMVVWPLPPNRYARGRLLMHESFHRVQKELGLPGSNPPNSHLDSEEGRIWLRLEWRALAEALIHGGERRRVAIADALMFRSVRHALFPRGAEEERTLELNEGLAEYTGYKLSGWPEAILADRAAIRLEGDEGGTSFVRSFAYASGPAWAILLDEVPVTWRPSLDHESELASILAEVLGIEIPQDVETEARRRAAAYDGAAVITREAARADLQRQAIARHQARFVDGPVLILPLGPFLRYTFSPQGAEALGELGTVYSTSRVSDEWGVLEVTGGVLMSRDQEGRMSEARVPVREACSGRTAEGAGWTLTLTEGWKVVPAARAGDCTVVPATDDERHDSRLAAEAELLAEFIRIYNLQTFPSLDQFVRPGASTRLDIFPRQRLALVVLSNLDYIAHRIAEQVHEVLEVGSAWDVACSGAEAFPHGRTGRE